MRLGIVGAVSSLALCVACAQAPALEAAPIHAARSSPPTSSGAADVRVVPPPGPALPSCKGEPPLSDTVDVVRCQLVGKRHTGRFTFADGVMQVDLYDAAGQPLQSFSAQSVRFFPPDVTDINGDGAPDILITTDVGNVNAVTDVWLQDAAANRFMPAGTVSGVGFERISDGLIAAPARSSAASWVVGFYKVQAFKLQEVAAVAVTYGDTGMIDHCELASFGQAASDDDTLTAAAAKTKFCDAAIAILAN